MANPKTCRFLSVHAVGLDVTGHVSLDIARHAFGAIAA
jgi:hypothetical protein